MANVSLCTVYIHMYCVMCFFQLNMVCDRAVLKSNGQMAFFGGLLTGSLLTGMISDRYSQEVNP